MNKVERLRFKFYELERIRLINRLNTLSVALVKENDWRKAEAIKQEMLQLPNELVYVKSSYNISPLDIPIVSKNDWPLVRM